MYSYRCSEHHAWAAASLELRLSAVGEPSILPSAWGPFISLSTLFATINRISAACRALAAAQRCTSARLASLVASNTSTTASQA